MGVYSWKKKYTSNQLNESFPEIGCFNAIRIISTTNTKRVAKALLYGPKGNYLYLGKQLRKRLKLKSTLVDFQIVSINPGNDIKKTNINLEQKLIQSGSYQYPAPPPVPGNLYAPTLPSINDYFLLVKGSGAGHGVGMSQWGAHGMAKNGLSYRRIIRHYYKGVKITPFLSRYLSS